MITGAAGTLGGFAREHLAGFADELRLSDVTPVTDLAQHETFVAADLGDKDAVEEVVRGCDGIVHFGGISVEKGFDLIERANLRGVFNLYEAARKHGNPRIIFASSNHAIGFYPQGQRIDADAPPLSDGLYGASKVYGEQLAVLYWQKFGVETARVRIGSCVPKPLNRRMLSTWLSPRDMFGLAKCCFAVPELGCPVVYGASHSDTSWWDNSKVAYLGWTPQDSAETYRAEVEAAHPPETVPEDESRFQGGVFTAYPIYQS
nr:NAD(P)-dependent oxidoreductase [Shimia biformata]